MPTTTRRDLTAAALACLTAAALAFVAQISEPFEHGTWLVAYLFLVGFLAQLLLGLGQTALLPAAGWAPPSGQTRLAQLVLWNLGVVAVPIGVLAEARLAVVIGSLNLIGALASLVQATRPWVTGARCHKSRLGYGYTGLLAAMLVSTLIGTALAWDIPWV